MDYSFIKRVLVLMLCVYSMLVTLRCKALNRALVREDMAYEELMTKNVNGKPLHTLMQHDTVGVFTLGGKTFACGTVTAQLPDLLK